MPNTLSGWYNTALEPYGYPTVDVDTEIAPTVSVWHNTALELLGSSTVAVTT